MNFLDEDILLEEKLTAAKRNKIDPFQFGLFKQRKYPLIDANHVRSAIRFFDKCPEKLKPELAMNIKKAAKKYGVKIDEKSKINFYAESTQIPYQEAPNNNQQTQNNNNAQAANADDAPTDYTDAAGAGAPTNNVTDAGSPDYTGEEQPEENEEDQQQGANTADAEQNTGDDQNIDLNGQPPENNNTTDQNDPNATNQDVNNTNTDVNPDNTTSGDAANTDQGTDAGGAEDTATDYTAEEPSGDDSEGDDGTGGEEGAEDTDTTTDGDTGDTGGDAGGATGLDAELQQLQQDVFSNLSDQQMQLRINSIKDSYIELYNNITNTSKRLIDVNRSSSNISTINFLNENLNSLKNMVRDALTDSFNTKSLTENEIILQKFISIYSMILKIVERLANKEEKDDKKNKGDVNDEDSFSSDVNEEQ